MGNTDDKALINHITTSYRLLLTIFSNSVWTGSRKYGVRHNERSSDDCHNSESPTAALNQITV